MYLSHYGLKRSPFQITSDPRFLWLGETHKEALATLKYGIYENKSFLLLTGDVGCGKTTVINSFVNRLNDTVLFGILSDPGLNLMDLLNHIAFLFRLDHTFKSKGEFIIHFTRFLNEAYGAKKRVLLIIDEAQRLSTDLLEEICMLSNIERQDAKLINIFLVGQNEFKQIVAQHPNRSLRQKLTFSCRITALDEIDLEKYVQHRLKVAGTTASLFSVEALSMIYRYSGGNPRLINILCDLSLLTGFVQEKNIIGGDIILECVEELQLVPLLTKDASPSTEQVEQTEQVVDFLEKIDGENLSPPVVVDLEETIWDKGGAVEQSGQEDIKKDVPGDSEISPSQGAEDEALTQETSTSLKGGGRQRFKRFFIFVGILLMLVCAVLFFYFPESVSDFTPFSDRGNNIFHSFDKVKDKEKSGALGNIDDKSENMALVEKEKEHTDTISEIFSVPTNSSQVSQGELDCPALEENSKAHPGNLSTSSDASNNDIAFAGKSETGILESVSFPRKVSIHFDYNSNDLSDAQRNEIAKVVDVLCHDRSKKVKIIGHSDSMGNPSYNLQLSKFRANMVKSYMIGKGVDSGQTVVEGKGADENLSKDDTPEGRWKNRRVEVAFLED